MRAVATAWPIHSWSPTGFQTLDSLSKVSLSNASTVALFGEAAAV